MGPRGARPGYALLLTVIFLITMSLIAAVAVTPNMAQVKDQALVERTLDRLALLTDSATSVVRFFDDLGNYPGALSHLSREIAGTDLTLCGLTYTGGQVGAWAGRYAGRLHLEAGTPLPLGLMRDTLEFDATPGSQALVVVLGGVREELALQLDRRVDGTVSGFLGRVRYTAADPEGLVTLRWRKAVAAC